MSNILAALGNAQLESLPAFIQARRSHTAAYARAFGDLPGVSVVGDPPWGRSNGWLTTVRFDSGVYPGGAERIRIALGAENIESRRIWQPMHRQPVFVDAEAFLTGAADALFAEGLTLPSGPSLTDEQRARVIQAVVAALGQRSDATDRGSRREAGRHPLPSTAPTSRGIVSFSAGVVAAKADMCEWLTGIDQANGEGPYIHQHFATPSSPGASRAFEFARRLVEAGHDVTVVAGDRHAARGWIRRDVDNGIQVIWIGVKYDQTMAPRRRIASFLRFAVAASVVSLVGEYDVVYASSTPLTVVIPG